MATTLRFSLPGLTTSLGLLFMAGAAALLLAAPVRRPAAPTFPLPQTAIVPAVTLLHRLDGEYSRAGQPVDAPRVTIRLRDLEIMRYQVTAADYARCVADGACKRLDKPSQEVPRLLDAAGGEARQPEGRAAVGAFVRQPRLEHLRQRDDVGPPGAAAQRHQLHRLGGAAHSGPFHAEAEQRVLCQRQQRDGIARPEGGFQRKPQQPGRRRGGERPAAGIVGLDAEAQKLGRDAPRQRPVAGHERGRPARFLDRAFQGHGDGRRLVALVGGFHQ